MSSHATSLTLPSASRSSSYVDPESAKYFVIPQRFIVSLIASIAILISVTSKSVLDVTVLENFTFHRQNKTFDVCPIEDRPKNLPLKQISVLDYEWNMETRYIIKNAFYWGSLLTRLPGGFIADQFGGKYIVALSMLLSNFCLVMIPGVIDISDKSIKGNVLIVGRFLQGFFDGPVFPGIISFLSRWVPISEHTTIIGFVFGIRVLGDQLGVVLNQAFVNYSWRPACYLSGGLGIVWCFFWYFLIYPTPWKNPYIRKKELRLLEEEIDEDIVDGWKRLPWKQIAVSMPVWSLLILYAGEGWNWAILMAITSLYVPTVLKGVPVWSSFWWIPFFLYFALAIIYGFVSDWFLNGKHLSITSMRKLLVAIEMTGAAVCIIFIAFERCNLDAIMVWYTVALCINPVYFVTNVVINLDMSSNFAGILYGLTSSVDKIVTTSGLHIIKNSTAENSLSSWSFLFYATSFVQLVTSLIFLYFGNAEKQPWNKIPS